MIFRKFLKQNKRYKTTDSITFIKPIRKTNKQKTKIKSLTENLLEAKYKSNGGGGGGEVEVGDTSL